MRRFSSRFPSQLHINNAAANLIGKALLLRVWPWSPSSALKKGGGKSFITLLAFLRRVSVLAMASCLGPLEEGRMWPCQVRGHGHPLPFLPLALTSLVKEECDRGHPFLLKKEMAREGSGHGHSSSSSFQKGQGKRRVWPWPLSLI